MGIFSALTDNFSEASTDELTKQYGHFLVEGEKIDSNSDFKNINGEVYIEGDKYYKTDYVDNGEVNYIAVEGGA